MIQLIKHDFRQNPDTPQNGQNANISGRLAIATFDCIT